ncbi:hypothetical protein HYU89_03425 [Candidatus Collierbacteria bacterium]|nr:hypothetical protein [Candidatus Collierbacteria bacterium]
MKKSFVEKGKQIYYQLKPQLEEKYVPEDYVTIDVETGDYSVAETSLEAIKKLKKRHPKKIFFLAQVGRVAGMLK